MTEGNLSHLMLTAVQTKSGHRDDTDLAEDARSHYVTKPPPTGKLAFSSELSALVFMTILLNCMLMLFSAICEPYYHQSTSIRDQNFQRRGEAMQQRWSAYRSGMPFDLEEATKFVFENTRHVERREVRLSENWIQWTLGQLYTPALEVQDPARLMRGGFASCSQRAQILKTMAEGAGLPCRFVGLEGHVMLEVKVDDDWRLADPDYGIAYDADLEVVQQPKYEAVVRAELRQHHWRGRNVDHYIKILQSAEDNRRLPIGSALSPRLYVVEQVCYWLAWLSPVPFLVLLRILGIRYTDPVL